MKPDKPVDKNFCETCQNPCISLCPPNALKKPSPESHYELNKFSCSQYLSTRPTCSICLSARVYLVPGVRGANSYLFLGKEGVVVVDTGMGGNASRIVEFAGRLGKQPTPIAYIVLTHSDFDHSGSVAQLSARALNMDQAKESVRKISELKFENLLPGHGPPITSNASAKLKGFVKNDFKNA